MVQSWRQALRWPATTVPVAPVLLLGMALGPRALNLLPPMALTALDPVVPVALAALGALVGLEGASRRTDDRRLLAGASIDTGVTLLVVGGGLAVLTLVALAGAIPGVWPITIAAGICAAMSLAVSSDPQFGPRTPSERVVELGVLPATAAGMLLMAWLRTGTVTGTALVIVQATLVTLALAAAGWLLLSRTATESEERIFGISALLLVGGTAAALSLSALFTGLVAGVCWRYVGGHACDTLTRDILLAQQPLLVLVLLVAGARADLSGPALTLGAAYFVLRTVGKQAGAHLAGLVLDPAAARDLPQALLPPGLFGVAFALNLATAVGGAFHLLLGAVVTGTVAAALLAAVPRGGRLFR